jgi:hypothetical protein
LDRLFLNFSALTSPFFDQLQQAVVGLALADAHAPGHLPLGQRTVGLVHHLEQTQADLLFDAGGGEEFVHEMDFIS